jgi:hypothetical protein
MLLVLRSPLKTIEKFPNYTKMPNKKEPIDSPKSAVHYLLWKLYKKAVYAFVLANLV